MRGVSARYAYDGHWLRICGWCSIGFGRNAGQMDMLICGSIWETLRGAMSVREKGCDMCYLHVLVFFQRG